MGEGIVDIKVAQEAKHSSFLNLFTSLSDDGELVAALLRDELRTP